MEASSRRADAHRGYGRGAAGRGSVCYTAQYKRARLLLEIGRALSLGASGIAAAVFLASVVHFL